MSLNQDTVRARLRPFGISFEKSLTDLIKGIRANKKDPEKLSAFLDQSIQECRNELKTTDLELKSMAILKLAYLEMYGFDMSWCAFQILEVLSSSKFQHKRIGYLAAIQILQRQTNEDALMLMTNLLKKDLNTSNYVESGMAISGIASIVTTELAQDICDDMVKLLSHSKPFIRKKAILAMYKIFLKYPEALRTHFHKLVDALDDNDNSVVSASVNVICELVHKNPSNYIDLTPRLFGALKSTNNNWMVIRLLKLFSSLSLIEPRLKFKLLPEILEIMNKTPACSLIYECINCILNGKMLTSDDLNIANLMIDHLLTFFQSDDQNLKYVSLLAFIKTCKIQKDLIKKHEKIIIECINDDDLTIREKALEIVHLLVSESNIVFTVKTLLLQIVPISNELNNNNNYSDDPQTFDLVVPESYKLEVINKIIKICHAENYRYIPNFKWYLNVLKDILLLNKENKIKNVDLIISQCFLDVALRVPSIRPYLVKLCIELIVTNKDGNDLILLSKGLKNFIWIISEYYEEYVNNADDIDDDEDEEDDDNDDEYQRRKPYTIVDASVIIQNVISQSYLKTRGDDFNDFTIPVYIQSLSKLLSKYANTLPSTWDIFTIDKFVNISNNFINWLSFWDSSLNFEIQERATSFIEVIRLVVDSLNSAKEQNNSNVDIATSQNYDPPNFLTTAYSMFFNSYELKPVSNQTQLKIPVPEDLDLNEPLNTESWNSLNLLVNQYKSQGQSQDTDDIYNYQLSDDEDNSENYVSDGSESKNTESKDERLERLKDDPYYISFDSDSKTQRQRSSSSNVPLQESSHVGDSVLLSSLEPKKPKKPKKIKKEKVLILDTENGDDDDRILPDLVLGGNSTSSINGKQLKKFLVDSSNLDNFNLKSTNEDDNNTLNDSSLDLDQLRKQFGATTLTPTDTAATDVVTVKKKKKKNPKKVSGKTESSENLSSSTPTSTPTPAELVNPGNTAEVVVKRKKPKKPIKKTANIQD